MGDLAGAGTCLDQSHSVLGRVAGAILIRSKWVLIFFFHVCDRPYRAITVETRSSVAKTIGRVSPNSLTWLFTAPG